MKERRALLIDDDGDHRNWLAGALRERAWDVIATGSGKLGLQIAATQVPDVIICELVLPDVLGLQLARAFRTALDHDVTIIAVTRMPELSSQALAATYDLVLTRPVDLVALLSHLMSPTVRPLVIDPLIAASSKPVTGY